MATPRSEFDGLNQSKQHFSLDRKDKAMNFLDGALSPRPASSRRQRCSWCRGMVIQADKQRIDEPKAIYASQGVFA